MFSLSVSAEELVFPELLRGSRRLNRSILSSATLVGASKSPSVVMLKACLNSCPPVVVLPSPNPAALGRVGTAGGARTVPSSGVFLPWGRGMVMLAELEGSERSGAEPEFSRPGEEESTCTGSWTDGGLSQVRGAQTGETDLS